MLNGYVQKEFTKKSDLLRYDLRLGLSDTTFKIFGFVAAYDCHPRSILDINEKKYFGNQIKASDPFIRNIWIGDHLVIDCINIEKNGKRYLIKGLQFDVY